MSVQQAGRAVVDALAAATEDASLATSRWCRGTPIVVAAIGAGVAGAGVLAFPLPLVPPLAFVDVVGVGGRRGRGRLRT
jgi:hypothetical protein